LYFGSVCRLKKKIECLLPPHRFRQFLLTLSAKIATLPVMSLRVVVQIGLGFAWVVTAWVVTVWSGISRADSFPPIRLCPASSPAVSAALYEAVPVRNNNLAVQTVQTFHTENWTWQLFPDGFIYPTYLAATQNRLTCVTNYDPDIKWNWDITLGGRAPLFRYGNRSALFPEGWQVDIEGSVHLRLALMQQMDMEANDFRVGLPFSYGTKVWQVRTGYYHVSSHVGDERVLRYINEGGWDEWEGDPEYKGKPTYRAGEDHHRLNYYREAWLLSCAYRPTPSTRLYAEVDYAFMLGELTKPWHFQFGAEYSPVYPARGGWGTPFAAVNVRLMQEFNFDGNFTLQTGWQWRGSRNELFRIGLQYFNGTSEQYSFITHPRERKIGIGVWYDF